MIKVWEEMTCQHLSSQLGIPNDESLLTLVRAARVEAAELEAQAMARLLAAAAQLRKDND